MQTEPIHLHDPAGEILCEAGRHNQGVLLLSTGMAVMTSCPKCLGALHQSAFTPITDGEMEALVRRAHGTLARAVEPLHEWLARRDAEVAVYEDFTDVLRLELMLAPRWRMLKRASLRRTIRRRDMAEFL